ncbi:MAG: TolC family outer membrane protein [Legionella sp.]|nr:TolC family outer membrane protein [Legionella sp.]
MRRSLLFCFFMFCCCIQLFASDLMDIYVQALDNDPIFKAAYDTYMVTSEATPQARAALLPQLAINTLSGRNYLKALAGGFSTADYYASNYWEFTASQSIFNYQAWAKVAQAKASVKAAQATFNDAAQDLMIRTARAYFEVLLAQDTLDFAEAKTRANKRQLDQATKRFQVGVVAITAVYEAQAAYDQSVATVITAKNNQMNQNENLRKLTNHYYEHLAPLRNKQIPLKSPEPDDVNQWVDTGLKQNFKLFSAKYNVEVAKENVKALSAGNWPVLSIQGNATETRNDVANNSVFLPKRQVFSNIAVAMNFPFFQGGLVQSQTRQAQSNFQLYSERLEQSYRDVIVNTRIAFNTLRDGISKVKADRKTIISQQKSLQSVEAQFLAGTRTMVDVVNAQRSLFEAQEQSARSQYNFINGMLNLKYLAGSLNANDLELVNSWLATTRVDGLPPNGDNVYK